MKKEKEAGTPDKGYSKAAVNKILSTYTWAVNAVNWIVNLLVSQKSTSPDQRTLKLEM